MSKKQYDTIANSDIGKTVANGNAEIANYNVFALTVTTAYNGISVNTTLIYSKSGGNKFGSFFKHSNNQRYYVGWTVSLSGNTFSVSGTCYNQFYQGAGANSKSGTINQIRVLG